MGIVQKQGISIAFVSIIKELEEICIQKNLKFFNQKITLRIHFFIAGYTCEILS